MATTADQIRRLIYHTANSIGADPIDLATAISYETGGTFDPLQLGPTTKHGRHRGLIQFGEPQARQYGVNWADPINSQLGENGAVAKYLKATGFKPGMGLLEMYSAINAGGIGPEYYGRSDAHAGGAPGDVQAKVASMGPHRDKATAFLQGQFPGKIGGDSMVARNFDPQIAGQTNTPFSGGTDAMFGGGLLSSFNRPINPELAALAGDEQQSTMGKIGGLLSALGEAIPDAPQPNLGPMPDATKYGGILSKFLDSMTRRV